MRVRVGLLAVVLVGYVATWAVLLHDHLRHRDLWFLVVGTALFLLAVALLARTPLAARHVAWLVLGVGAVLQVVAVTHSPATSDDAFRYVWDGKVQLSGTDPYRYPPSSPELAHLRDGFLFGPSSACSHEIPGGCTAINRPEVRTIYPPVAEGAFTLVRIASFGGRGGLLPFQIVAALGAFAIAVLLVRRALRRGTAVWPVALWAWCPVVVSDLGNNAHIDWLGVLLTVLAMQARRPLVGAGLLGAAISTKLYPALALPSLMRRRPWAVASVAVGVVAIGYVPHVLAVGRDVLGYLPGYLNEEGYNSGSRLLLLGEVLPHPLDTVVGAAILAGTALWAWRRSVPSAPEQTATVLTGVAFLVVTPSYGWYAPILMALAIMSARYEWFALALAPAFVYLVTADVTHWRGAAAITYAVGAVLTALLWWLRLHGITRDRERKPTAEPDSGTRPSRRRVPSLLRPSRRNSMRSGVPG